jgi:hypothetical protein
MRIGMLQKALAELTGADLDVLVTNAQPESLQLEFKRELNLARDAEKKEAAKDVSGMANAAGGRIVYGIEERDGTDGQKVAGALAPLTDPGLQERLDSVLSSSITPRVQVRLQPVRVSGGYCLVVEVPPSFAELHMVTAYGDSRYHVRTETAVVRMQEPEVKRRYGEILRLQASAGDTVEKALQQELPARQNLRSTFLGVPLMVGSNIFDPHGFDARAVLGGTGVHFETLVRLFPCRDGLQCLLPEDSTLSAAPYALRLRRDGVVHSGKPLDSQGQRVYPLGLLTDFLTFTRVCRAVWEYSGVRGPADLVLRFMVPAGGKVDAGYPHPVPPPGLSLERTSEVSIPSRVDNVRSDFGLGAARQAFHLLWQYMGESTCDYFESNGALKPWVAERVKPV